ncbi:MAG TPA: WecB/TagA/CpsF family glycosyltransferase [Planctomycetota bacterium]|jgi:N-acetylglucosaminyldiphosphoundecaprenol N-acetyl-beta-D-mannosaminyltransferase
MDIPRLTILGTRVASLTYNEAVEAIMELAAPGPAHAYVCAVNVHTVSVARRDPGFREVLNGAFLALPDGKPLVWAHRLLGGRRLPDRVYGPTLMLHLCRAAAERGVPIYLYGGADGVAEKLGQTLKEQFPTLQVAGTCSPPFREEKTPDSRLPDSRLEAEIAAINASGARLVFVALGAPKQERFMARHAKEIEGLQIGVGAAFDFHTQRVKQAPAWMQGAGLEWLFRFCAEPRRLWRRYLVYNPYFVVRLMLQWLGLDGPSRDVGQSAGLPAQSRGLRHNGNADGKA